MRLKIIRLIIVLMFVMVVMNLFWIQVIRGKHYFYLSKHNRIRTVSLEGGRGRIKDRQGIILADNRTAYDAVVMPQDIIDQEKLFAFLSTALATDKAELMKRYRQKKLTPFTPVVIAADIAYAKAVVLEENKYRFPSLLVQESFKRVYPLKENSAHLLGYVGRVSRAEQDKLKAYGVVPQSLIGKDGIEKFYDGYLRGSGGGLQIEVNSRGQQVRLLSMKAASPGEDITLTIDSHLQAIAGDVLSGERGAVVVMETSHGEILGLTSSPTYDPNLFVASRRSTRLSDLFNDSRSPLLNRTIKGVFPPGSVFKVVGALAALDQKKLTQYSTFHCKGFYELGGKQFRCTHVHGPQNMVASLAHSCNVYYYHLGLIVGAEQLQYYAQLLGLGQLTHIDLPHEKSGFIPGPKKRTAQGKRRRWFQGDTLNFSIGQGDVLTTPLQLVQMMAMVAQDGRGVQPHLIKMVGSVDVEGYESIPPLLIDPSSFDIIKKGLRATVANYSGTAQVLNLPNIYVAGKTGTAQSSGDQDDHSWFVGYAQGQERQVAFAVFLEHGGSSQNACLVARRLLLRMKQERML